MTAKKTKTAKAAKKPATFLSKGEKPFSCVNPAAKTPVLIVCDHASNAMPRAAKNLGLAAKHRKMHIAWDPGTEHIGRYLAKKLKSRLVLANFSRLVVDLNRGHDHAECMRAISDHVRVPGNAKLTPAQKEARLQEIYWPYHGEIDRHLDEILASGRVPLILSIHSFTPQMDGFDRPWHIGVMWDRQEKLARRLVKTLRHDNPALVVGENEPYTLKGAVGGRDTMHRHGEERGLPYLIVEFRQDLVGGSREEAEGWAELFLRSLQPILDDASVYRRQKVPGKTPAKKKPAARKKAVARVVKPARKKPRG